MKLPKSLKDNLQSMYNGLAEQYESIDSEIASHKKSIKNLNQMKKDIEADLTALEEIGVGVEESIVEEDVENGENQKENA